MSSGLPVQATAGQAICHPGFVDIILAYTNSNSL